MVCNNLGQHGLRWVLARGPAGFELMVGKALLSGNLHRIRLLLRGAAGSVRA